MSANLQASLTASDLETILAISRGGTLASAGERLHLDSSTVFRTVQRIERMLGQRLFERSRTGYLANDLALSLASHAERVESEVEAARPAAQLQPNQLAGTVRITTTDTILHGLVAPALLPLQSLHPQLHFDLQTGNELANLTKREADIAVRATKRPPQHLVGKQLGNIRMALFAGKLTKLRSLEEVVARAAPWITTDEAMPDHPSVLWRKKHYPKIIPRYKVSAVSDVAELVASGLGVGILPLFLAQRYAGLAQLSDVLDECQTELWLLTHAESKHLRRVAVVYAHLAVNLRLE
jgi:DNA-binding transcriptional LysR family regulator